MRYLNYIAEVMCKNCRKRARIKVPTGTQIDSARCPRCGMKNLHHPSYFGIKKGEEDGDYS